MDKYNYIIEEEYAGQRLDKALAGLCNDLSRARIQTLIADGQARINGMTSDNASGKVKVKIGDTITLNIPAPVPAKPEAENIPLDIIYEDADLLVINKPAGLVVHPGAGNWSGTLVNALLHHCAGELSGIGGVERPGIVHRLDKDTSGLMVAAKSNRAHQGLAAQLADRSLSRIYHALVLGVPVPIKGAINMSIGRDPRNRQRQAVNVRGGRDARTFYHMRENYGDACSLVECKLESGRTHQIRVHMAALKHPLIGDPLYGPQPTAVRAKLAKAGMEEPDIEQILTFPRQALHAGAISFIHPVSEERMSFKAPPPDDFTATLKKLSPLKK
ncbi:MAG: RluA family pseudouridine synthase [Alphaproteobacteria bacterium]